MEVNEQCQQSPDLTNLVFADVMDQRGSPMVGAAGKLSLGLCELFDADDD